MKIYRCICFLCFLPSLPIQAALDAPETPAFLRFESNAKPDAVDVFEAFHSKATNPTTVRLAPTSPILQGPAIYPFEFRTPNGLGNNPTNLGASNTPHLRNTTVGYGDGISTPAGADRLGARDISNMVHAQSTVFPISGNLSSYVWLWGQFVSHDMSLTVSANPAEVLNIPVPKGDGTFDPRSRGDKVLPFQRSSWSLVGGIRQQLNNVTAFIDASQVYGSNASRANELRTLDGTGHLKTSDNNLLPFNVDAFPNQPESQPGKIVNPADFFLAGDVRSNENSALTALQTVFMREHNFWADTIKAANPTLDDNGIYLRARAIVGAEIQLITYRDFLPILLGANALTPYPGYNFAADPRTSIAFSTAAFRVGHTFLPPVLSRLNSRGQARPGDIALGATFFNPPFITLGGIEPYLRGLGKQIPQQVDPYIIDAVRCFVTPGAPLVGFDLAALDIQRGRDHGLPGYNQVRIDFGLAPKLTFADMTSNLDVQARLALACSSPDKLDVIVGGLAEDHFNDAQVGETFFTILKDQFQRSRDGDRFWYESYLDPATLATVQQQTLGAIIKRNATIGAELQDDVFHVPTSP